MEFHESIYETLRIYLKFLPPLAVNNKARVIPPNQRRKERLKRGTSVLSEVSTVSSSESYSFSPIQICGQFDIMEFVVIECYEIELNQVMDWIEVKVNKGIFFQFLLSISEMALQCSIIPAMSETNKSITLHMENNQHSRSFATEFNETKVFKPVTESDLSTMTLNVKMYDWNRVMNNRLIGEVNCSLGIILDNDDGTHSNGKRTVMVHRNIIVPTNSEDYLGSLLLSLNLDLQSQQMKVTIFKAKDLKAMDANNFSDPYCTIKLFSDDEKIGSRKTSIKYKTLSPIWNESFPFLVTPKAYQKNLKLQIRVYDKDVTGKDFIGEVEFPSSAGSIEWKHWASMVDNPTVTTGEWHSLKPKAKKT